MERKIGWVVSSFDHYKLAGPDTIFPTLLQISLLVILPWLVVIYESITNLGYFPKKWREGKSGFYSKMWNGMLLFIFRITIFQNITDQSICFFLKLKERLRNVYA